MSRRAVASFAVTIMLAAAASASVPAASAASDCTAVFIVSGAGTDAALGDNLTEVAIAKLAERSPGERVGTHELRRWIEKSGNAEPVPACLSRVPCLRRLGAELGVHKIISGSVLADGAEFTIALTLLDADSGAVEATSTKMVSGVELAIRAVQDAVVELLQPRVVASRLELAPPPATPGVLVSGESPADARRAPAAQRGWPFYAGLGAAAAGVLSLSAAGILTILANEDPTGATRAEVQRDLATRETYSWTAGSLWLVGGALGATAIALLIWQRS